MRLIKRAIAKQFMSQEEDSDMRGARYSRLIAILAAVCCLTMLSCGDGDDLTDPGDGDPTETAISWTPPQQLLHFNYYQGQLTSVTTYMRFECTSGSGEVEVSATLYEVSPGTEMMTVQRDTIAVQEGSQYNCSASVRMIASEYTQYGYRVTWRSPSASSAQVVEIPRGHYQGLYLGTIQWD
jgi:hypothetical protein